MSFSQVIWDDPDDPNGNVEHIAEHGLTIDEVETVLLNPVSEGKSHSTEQPFSFGYTPTGEYIIVIYELVGDDAIYPVTAYEVPEPSAWRAMMAKKKITRVFKTGRYLA